MQPDEEPEAQLLHVSDAQLAGHLAAKKAAADKSAGMGALGGFAAASAAPVAPAAGSSASSDGGLVASKQAGGVDAAGGAGQQAAAPVLDEVQRLKLQLEQQQLRGE